MAVLWSKKTANTLYEVRNSGKTVRLYSNGIFHSQWHPQKPLAGHLWDLLVLPAFLKEQNTIRSALVLGVGGGAVLNSLNYFFTPKKIVGVDLDATHLEIAKRFFKCNSSNIQLDHAEASAYLARYKRRYDYLVDDIFMENPLTQNDAIRAITVDKNWLATIESHLKPKGVYVANFENKDQLASAHQIAQASSLGFKHCLCLQSLRYENAIGVFLHEKLDTQSFEKALDLRLTKKQRKMVIDNFIFDCL